MTGFAPSYAIQCPICKVLINHATLIIGSGYPKTEQVPKHNVLPCHIVRVGNSVALRLNTKFETPECSGSGKEGRVIQYSVPGLLK